jgi:hypothetical protein
MTRATNRRAVLGVVFAGATIGATTFPALAASAAAPEPSASDHEVLDLWHGRQENFRMAMLPENDAESDRFGELGCDCEWELNKRIGASVLALGAVLIMEIGHDDHEFERVPRLYRAALAAIRPQLVGAIAEDADRVLAQAEEEEART